MGDHAFEKGTVGAAPALVDGGAVRASAPGPVEFKTLVDPSPELETVVLNFGPSDYATIGTFFVVNALGGWRFGGAIRGPTAGTTGMLGPSRRSGLPGSTSHATRIFASHNTNGCEPLPRRRARANSLHTPASKAYRSTEKPLRENSE